MDKILMSALNPGARVPLEKSYVHATTLLWKYNRLALKKSVITRLIEQIISTINHFISTVINFKDYVCHSGRVWLYRCMSLDLQDLV